MISAKEELQKYKLIKQQISALQISGDNGIQARTEAQQRQTARNKTLDSYDQVIHKELTHIQRVLPLAKSSRDEQLIQMLTRAMTRCQQQKKKIMTFRSAPERTLPTGVVVQTVVDRLIVVNNDVPDNVLLLTIHHIENAVYKKETDRSVNLFIKFNFGYPRKQPIVGETEMITGNIGMTAWGHCVNIPLGTGKLTARATLRHFEKKKISFEIYHRKQHMFSSTDVVICKAECSLATMLNKSTAPKLQLPLFLEERRKPVGGHLVVSMKMRKPLQGKDVREIQRKMLVFGSGSVRK
jgi:hypothetical protein